MKKDFRIHFADEQFEELRRRISMTRLPEPIKGDSWSLGTDVQYLSSLLSYWRDSYDWRRKETELNQYPQFTCE